MQNNRYVTLLCEAVVAKLQDREPRLPAGSPVLWRAFADLSRARAWSSLGPNPISFSEIEAWCRLNRTPLSPRHVQTILAMDEAFIEHFASSRSSDTPEGVNTLPQRSRQSLSPALFDAVMG